MYALGPADVFAGSGGLPRVSEAGPNSDPNLTPSYPHYISTLSRWIGYEKAEAVARVMRQPKVWLRSALCSPQAEASQYDYRTQMNHFPT